MWLLKEVENAPALDEFFYLFILQLLNCTLLSFLEYHFMYVKLTVHEQDQQKSYADSCPTLSVQHPSLLFSAIIIEYTQLLELLSPLPLLNEISRLWQGFPSLHHSPGCVFKPNAGEITGFTSCVSFFSNSLLLPVICFVETISTYRF